MSSRSKTEAIEALVCQWRLNRTAGDARDDTAFRLMGINRTAARCLESLEVGEMSSTALAQASGVTGNALTTVVDRLEARGLVERVTDPRDRRRTLVRRTALANRISNQVFGPVRAWSRQNLGRYSLGELGLLVRYTEESRRLQERHLEYLSTLSVSWDLHPEDGPRGKESA